MIKILLLLLISLLFLIPSFCFGEDNYLHFFYQGNEVGAMPIADFEAMIRGVKEYIEIMDAENNNRVKIDLKDNPWDFEIGDTFKTDIRITWITKDMKVTKELIIGLSMKAKKENYSNMLILYRDVASWGFPISAVLNIILIVILAL